MSAGWHKWALDINSTVITEMFLDWIKKYYIGNTIVIITFIIITIIIIVATITIIITFKFFFKAGNECQGIVNSLNFWIIARLNQRESSDFLR